MKDDDLLAALRDHVRAERADDATLEAIAGAGRSAARPSDAGLREASTSASVAALEARAAEDPAVAELLRATQPLGPEAEARIVARSLAARAPVTPSKDDPSKPTAEEGVKRPTAASGGVVVSLLRRSALLVGPLALAAAIALYVTAGPGPGVDLPSYEVTAAGEQSMRGPATSPTSGPRIRVGAPEATFQIVLRPEVTVAAKVAVWAFTVGAGEPDALDAKVELAPEGGVRIRGKAKALLDAREIRVVVAPAEGPSRLARFDEALAHARAGTSTSRVRVLRVEIDR